MSGECAWDTSQQPLGHGIGTAVSNDIFPKHEDRLIPGHFFMQGVTNSITQAYFGHSILSPFLWSDLGDYVRIDVFV